MMGKDKDRYLFAGTLKKLSKILWDYYLFILSCFAHLPDIFPDRT